MINDMLKRLKVAQEIKETLGLNILVILEKQFPKLRQQWMLIRIWIKAFYEPKAKHDLLVGLITEHFNEGLRACESHQGF